MKRTKATKGGTAASVREKKAENKNIQPRVELDRRGNPLPPRQRVGGIITPQ
jgi:hypothetical protein